MSADFLPAIQSLNLIYCRFSLHCIHSGEPTFLPCIFYTSCLNIFMIANLPYWLAIVFFYRRTQYLTGYLIDRRAQYSCHYCVLLVLIARVKNTNSCTFLFKMVVWKACAVELHASLGDTLKQFFFSVEQRWKGKYMFKLPWQLLP